MKHMKQKESLGSHEPPHFCIFFWGGGFHFGEREVLNEKPDLRPLHVFIFTRLLQESVFIKTFRKK